MAALDGSGLAFIDAGSLKRARELEAMGFLQIALAVSEKISWTGGFRHFSLTGNMGGGSAVSYARIKKYAKNSLL